MDKELTVISMDVSPSVAEFMSDIAKMPKVKSSRKGVAEMVAAYWAAGNWDELKKLRNGREGKGGGK